jgi:hypothetical protein
MPIENVFADKAYEASEFFYSKTCPEGDRVKLEKEDWKYVAIAGTAALAFSNPKRMKSLRNLMESNPFDDDEFSVFTGKASEVVRRMCESYELGNNVFTQEQIRMAGAVCEFVVEHIGFIEGLVEYQEYLLSLKPYQKKAILDEKQVGLDRFIEKY